MKPQTIATAGHLADQLDELARDVREALADGRVDLAEVVEVGFDIIQVGGALVALAAPDGLFPKLRKRLNARRAARLARSKA